MVFLSATLVLSILSAFGVVRWELAAVTGGLSLAQFVGAFFTQPSSDLQRNLTNLAVLKMILESHSLKTAIARFHLTTPQALRELQTEGEADDATAARSRRCRRSSKAIEDVDRADFAALERLGFGRDGHAATGTADSGAPVGQRRGRCGRPRKQQQSAEPAALPRTTRPERSVKPRVYVLPGFNGAKGGVC